MIFCTVNVRHTGWGFSVAYAEVGSAKEQASLLVANDFTFTNNNHTDFQGDSTPNELYTYWSPIIQRQFRNGTFNTAEEVVAWLNTIPDHFAVLNYHEVP